MVLPIYTFGADVLRNPATDVEGDSPELQALIDDMFETLAGASGIGLAAPQVGKSIRLFVVDLSPIRADLEEDGEQVPETPLVFINPTLEDESSDLVTYEEGCLSIPDVREEVDRPGSIRIRFLDRNFEQQELETEGMVARVIQHEYDHLDGVLFIDHLSSFRRSLLRRRLKEMSSGNVEADYPLAV